jgi:hypothetical protein
MWLWAYDDDGFSEPVHRGFYTYIDGVAAISGTPTTNDPQVNLSIALTNPEDVAKDVEAGASDDGFICQLDDAAIPGQTGLGPKGNDNWSRCDSDVTLTLADGLHTFKARSRLHVGGGSAGYSLWGPVATRTFTVDTSAARACAAATATAERARAKVGRVRERLRNARRRGHRKAARRYRAALADARAASRAAHAAAADAC